METTEYSLHDFTTKAEHYAAAAEHCAYDVRLKLRLISFLDRLDRIIIDRISETLQPVYIIGLL